MKTTVLFRAVLAALPLLFLSASCVMEDWDDDYSYGPRRRPARYYDYDYDYGYDDYYDAGYDRRPRHPPRDDWRRDDRRHDDRRRDNRRDSPPRASAPNGYMLAGSFSAGKAIECGIPTSRAIKKVMLVGKSGTVAVNTMVLREGSAKTSYTVSSRITPGQTRTIDLGGARHATGLRISTGGKGSYEVYVQ